MQKVEFKNEVKKHIQGEDENGNILVDFTSLNEVLNAKGFGSIQKTFDTHIIKSDKEVLAKELGCSIDECFFLDETISPFRRYKVKSDIYSIEGENYDRA